MRRATRCRPGCRAGAESTKVVEIQKDLPATTPSRTPTRCTTTSAGLDLAAQQAITDDFLAFKNVKGISGNIGEPQYNDGKNTRRSPSRSR
ncbi:hypothetical protein ACU686_44150 [Yinghuangia aomiensis]